MTRVDFNNRKVDFFSIISFVRKNNLNHSRVLEQAFQQEVLVDDNKNLLSNFISSIKNKNDIKSQLYQDVFASFVIGDKFDKTFFEFCGDNAAMIAMVGLEKFKLKQFDNLDHPAKPRWPLDETAAFLKGAGVKL